MEEEPLTARRIRRALIACWLVSLAVLLVLRWANLHIPVGTWALGSFAIAFGLGLTGLVVTGRLPRNAVGWIFLTGGSAQAVTGATREVVVRGAWPHSTHTLVWEWVGWAGAILEPIALFSLPLMLLYFPDGRLISPSWRPVRNGVVIVGFATIVLDGLTPGGFIDELSWIRNPMGVGWLGGSVAPTAYTAINAATAALILISLVSLVGRWKRSDADTRAQLRIIVVTGTLLAAEVICEITGTFDQQWGSLVLLLFIGSVGFAVLRHHLWDLDVVINVSLVYGGLTVLAAGVFVTAVTTTGVFIDGRPALWPGIVAVGVALAVLVPLHRAVQAVVDRMLYGRHHDPHRLLSSLSRRPAMDQRPDVVLQDVVDEIAATYLRLGHVELRTEVGMAVTGDARTAPTAIPVRFQGEQVGVLEIAPRPGSSLAAPIVPALQEVADQIASVVRGLAVADAVRRMREEVVAAREEERRRLRRDIHDGVGPALAAVALQVEGAAAMVDQRPDMAKAMLQRLGREVTQVLDDVRRIVHDLVPPVLDALGLEGALRQQAVSFSASTAADRPGLDVRVVTAGPLGDLPAGVELTAYRIACEALTNVAKHAAASCCVITLTVNDGQLGLTVDDDGVGLRPGAYGVGTLSMIERATAIGGTCRLVDGPLGGVRVAAGLPIPQTATHMVHR